MKNHFYFVFFLCSIQVVNGFFFPFTTQKKPFYIVIETQGNPGAPGRIIDDSFESEITFSIAHHLKNILQEKHRNLKILVQRSDGLSNASMANRMNVDLYLQIGACKGNSTGIYLFSFSYNDPYILKDGMSFIPYDQIYLLNQTMTISRLETVSTFLQKNQLLKGRYTFPYRPLIGIKAPAFAIEISVKNKSEIVECINQFALSLEPIIKD